MVGSGGRAGMGMGLRRLGQMIQKVEERSGGRHFVRSGGRHFVRTHSENTSSFVKRAAGYNAASIGTALAAEVKGSGQLCRWNGSKLSLIQHDSNRVDEANVL